MEEYYFSKVVGFSLQLKLTLLHGCFSRFLNCINSTKSRSASQTIVESRFIKNNPVLISYTKR